MKSAIVSACLSLWVVFCLHPGDAGALSMTLQDALVERNGLSWLPPHYTEEFSYNEISRLATEDGGDLFGLRFATTAEVRGLVDAYGLVLNQGPVFDGREAFQLFYDDFSPGTPSVVGLIVRDPGNWDDEPGGLAWFEWLEIAAYGDGNHVHWDTWPRYLDRPSDGWWMVYPSPAPVPEPGAILLVGMGLVALMVRRKWSGTTGASHGSRPRRRRAGPGRMR